jgi:mannose-6-phosphate isomerase-like protein (cupin superfamily)
MKRRRFIVTLAGGMLAAPLAAEAQKAAGYLLVAADEETPATFTKDKFALPLSQEIVKADWTARGYSDPRAQYYAQGWTKGEHSHPVSLIMTIVTGRMEFVFAARRFVIDPGDELFYPAYTVHAARNLYDGTTQMMESYKR